MKRTFSLAAFGLVVAAAAAPQETQYFEEPPAKPQFSLRWDFLARYDRIDHRPSYELIDRGRFEVRPEVDFEPIGALRLGVRGVFDYGTEPDEYPEFDNFRSRGGALERYYALWTPGRFALRAGRFGMPLLASDMLWDRDIQTPGGAAAWESSDGSWTVAAAGFYAPQRDGDRSRIGVGQIVWRTGEETGLLVEAAASYWDFDLRHMPAIFMRENSARFVVDRLQYAADFQVTDLLLRLRFRIGAIPVLLSLDGIYNFQAAPKRDSAFEATVSAGRVGTPGQWRAFYTYQYVERDALVGAYNTDDWWFHTWYQGHRAGIAFTILPQTYLQVSGSLQRRLDTRNWVNRTLVDLVKLF
ncbi:MAG: hypothetical protein ABI968_13140 [Acidobacteriota bacterium]